MPDEICRAAQDHADDIGPKGVVAHQGTDGSKFSDRIKRYTVSAVQVNISLTP